MLGFLVLGFSACGDDDDQPNNPEIGTITTIINEDPQFSTLAAAFARTEVGQRLNVPTQRFTLYAPTNQAFENANIDLASLSDAELTNILNYHVIAATHCVRMTTPPAAHRLTPTTEPHSAPATPAVALPLTFDNDGGTIRINDMATAGDAIEAVNGVIYPIDMLLTPPDAAAVATLDGRFTTLLAALERTGLDQVLADSGTYTIFAPTDDAFDAYGVDLATISTPNLTKLLAYHVLPSAFLNTDIPGWYVVSDDG